MSSGRGAYEISENPTLWVRSKREVYLSVETDRLEVVTPKDGKGRFTNVTKQVDNRNPDLKSFSLSLRL